MFQVIDQKKWSLYSYSRYNNKTMIITYLLTKVVPLCKALFALVCLWLFSYPVCVYVSVCRLFMYWGVGTAWGAHPVKTDQYSTILSPSIHSTWQIALSTPWYIVQFRSSANTHTNSGDQSDWSIKSFQKYTIYSRHIECECCHYSLCLWHEKSNCAISCCRNFLPARHVSLIKKAVCVSMIHHLLHTFLIFNIIIIIIIIYIFFLGRF